MSTPRGSELPLAVGFSGLIALVLALMALPVWLMAARPDWLGLWVVYWITRQPARIGMGMAWLVGLLMDGVGGGVLGRHALALAVVAYACLVLRSRMLIYTLPQQMALVFLMTTLDQLLCHWVQNLSGHSTPNLSFLMGPVASAILWPMLAMIGARDATMESWRSPH
ncbi:MAG: rod shape-determining protein MreD [Pseudomonadales bacterium]|nr:rod shape-determining protein MreD [Pseudomonadales bacterium]